MCPDGALEAEISSCVRLKAKPLRGEKGAAPEAAESGQWGVGPCVPDLGE